MVLSIYISLACCQNVAQVKLQFFSHSKSLFSQKGSIDVSTIVFTNGKIQTQKIKQKYTFKLNFRTVIMICIVTSIAELSIITVSVIALVARLFYIDLMLIRQMNGQLPLIAEVDACNTVGTVNSSIGMPSVIVSAATVIRRSNLNVTDCANRF